MAESEQLTLMREARAARGAGRRDFFKLAAAGAAVGQSVTVNYCIRFMDQGEAS